MLVAGTAVAAEVWDGLFDFAAGLWLDLSW
jgi:hypothetical protein